MPEPSAQGQIWSATSRLSGRKTTVVLLDSDVVIHSRPVLVVAPIREAREVPSRHQLLTVAMAAGSEVVALYDIAILPKETMTEHLGALPADVLERVKIGLRARFDL
ncbi:type II toxin-antitoxin system PemK/MazF family toxin [Nocardia brasiliensis]|uniref:type II toxin-antitoxin system PemK/MazF family toxin n=1 Tax=Nocardia brasiliensis TaxID=37326 RepID=UPI0034042FF9